MKRFLLAPLAGLIVAGAVSGFAASLNITPGGIGANSVAVGTCDTDGVVLSYVTAFGTEYEVDKITVSGINTTACKSISIHVGTQTFNDTDFTVGSGDGQVVGTAITVDVTNTSANTFVGPVDVVVAS